MSGESGADVGAGEAPHPRRRGARSAAREAALHVLFALDPSSPEGLAATVARELDAYWRTRAEAPPDLAAVLAVDEPEARSFAERLCLAVADRLDEVDAALRAASTHWRLERMGRVDRAILRLGAGELLMEEPTPAAVVIDEAVELAKSYGTEDSGAFVNGVLARIAADRGA
jgi:N utilization substance protein B